MCFDGCRMCCTPVANVELVGVSIESYFLQARTTLFEARIHEVRGMLFGASQLLHACLNLKKPSLASVAFLASLIILSSSIILSDS